jgi:hypothetical protein
MLFQDPLSAGRHFVSGTVTDVIESGGDIELEVVFDDETEPSTFSLLENVRYNSGLRNAVTNNPCSTSAASAQATRRCAGEAWSLFLRTWLVWLNTGATA